MDETGVIQGDLPGQVVLREWVQARAEYWAHPPYGPCTTTGCINSLPGSRELLGQDDPRCADCRQRTANRRQHEMSYPCDKCGREAAFRDPLHRQDVYLCSDCHNGEGYEPGERAMVTKVAVRVGVTHPLGRKSTCILAGPGTKCGGEVKQRSHHGEICNRHWNPKKYDANKGS